MNNEIWQVEVKGQIYQADFEELKQWIVERALLPEDKVRKGEMRWTQAYHVPLLKKVFDGETATTPIQPVAPKTSFTAPTALPLEKTVEPPPAVPETPRPQIKFGNHCYYHNTAAAAYMCRECSNLFCKSCPKSFGTVRICPLCGEMCDTFAAYQQKNKKTARRRQGMTEGFGITDFARAWSYPFKFWQTLCLGALIVALLSFGGFFGNLLANIILYACMLQIIGQVAHGNLETNFMPDINSLKIYDDVIKPFFLSIGVSIVCWTPLIILLLLLSFNVLNSISNPSRDLSERRINVAANANSYENSPSTQILLKQKTALSNSSAPVVASDINTFVNVGTVAGQENIVLASELETPSSSQIKVEKTKAEYELMMEMLTPILRAAFPLLLMCVAAFLWGVFYLPVALAIAGYTRSFVQTINPIVGMDTISRMGVTYLIAFVFVLLVQIVSVVFFVIISAILSPFDMPFFGNLPAKFIGSVTTFYFTLVIAFIVGSALYKTSDRIDIQPA